MPSLAFPGAEGHGRYTEGGRGGSVYYVTNLNNSGAGSLRVGVSNTSGPRIIVFLVSGIINLTNNISITNPYLTIAGQTAPGDGICIKGGGLTIRTHNVIVRGIRFRPGGTAEDLSRGIEVSTGSHDVIIDHCSFSWGTDLNLMTWNTSGAPKLYNTTIQKCIFADPVFSRHNVNLGSMEKDGVMEGIEDFSLLSCLIMNADHRNPKIIGYVEVINNLVYNWGVTSAVDVQLNGKLDLIGNHYKSGPSSDIEHTVILSEPTSALRVYVEGNIAPEQPTGGGNQWDLVDAPTSPYQSLVPTGASGYQAMSANAVEAYVLENAGAFPRDAVDLEIIAEYEEDRGTLKTAIGTYPTYSGSQTQAEWEAFVATFPGGIEDAINSFYVSESEQEGEIKYYSVSVSGTLTVGVGAQPSEVVKSSSNWRRG